MGRLVEKENLLVCKSCGAVIPDIKTYWIQHGKAIHQDLFESETRARLESLS